MKIRWIRNSVRFRITPLELAAIERGDHVEETLALPNNASWSAAIVPTSSATSLGFASNQLRISLSETDRQLLSEPEREGVYFGTDDENGLRFFIEKDFPCAHPRAAGALEPATETFAPPADFEERKNA
jgi:hypothetical protein